MTWLKKNWLTLGLLLSLTSCMVDYSKGPPTVKVTRTKKGLYIEQKKGSEPGSKSVSPYFISFEVLNRTESISQVYRGSLGGMWIILHQPEPHERVEILTTFRNEDELTRLLAEEL